VNIIRRAITESDGETVNVGYMSLFWLMVVVLGVIPLMCVVSVYAAAKNPDKIPEIVQSLGMGVGAACGGFATALAALGVYIKLDPPKEAAQ
jgi:hypothetical protein